MKKPSDLNEYDDFALELFETQPRPILIAFQDCAYDFELGEAKAIRDKLTEMIEYLEGLENENKSIK